MKKKVSCIILAAGEAKRFGYPKQLLKWEDSTILGSIIDKAVNADFCNVIVVLGAHYEKICKNLKRSLEKVKVVYNENWKEGMFSSVIKGMEAIQNIDTDYILVQLGDMPFITSEIFNLFIKAADKEFDFIIAEESERPAHPYMFKKKYVEKILNGNFKNGMKDIIKEKFSDAFKVKLDNYISRQDIDTWDVYEKFKKISKKLK